MFRISKQLEICRLIHGCATAEELCEQFKLIVNTIGVEESQRILSYGFLTFKSRYENQLLDQLLASSAVLVKTENKNENGNCIKRNNNTICKLDSITDAILFHISFYLPIKSCLNLSMTNHSFHKTIQNNQCFNHRQHTHYKPLTLNLNPTIFTTIGQNNCIMECMHNHRCIGIKTPHYWAYSNIDCTDCPLSRLIDKIQNSNINKNYDLTWFKTIWKNMTHISISNRYPCALKHIPISWIFEASKHKMSKPIDVLSAAPDETCGMTKLIFENLCNRVKCYIDHNPDKKIRQIGSLWYDRRQIELIKVFSSFGNNLTGIWLDLPRLWDNKCRFPDLDTFFKVFHRNLCSLQIYVDGVNIKKFNVNIISQLFKNNLQLCHDLIKTEEQLSFKQFLVNYHCQDKCLPEIRHLTIDFNHIFSYKQSALFKLLNNDKMAKLLNLQQSVEHLVISVYLPCVVDIIERKTDIKNLSQFAISKMDNLASCVFLLHASLRNPMDEKQMEQVLNLSNAILLQMVMKPTAKYVLFAISGNGFTHQRELRYTIRIKKKNELSYRNQDLLIRKISSIVDYCIQDAKEILRQNGMVCVTQCFQFQRDYAL